MPNALEARLDTFDEIVSWYGSNRPEFRGVMPRTTTFLAALPARNWEGHATDFFLKQVGAPVGLIPRIEIAKSEPRNSVVIHPFSGSTHKNWPLQKYRELAAKLPVNVEWTAGPEEVLEGAHRFQSLLELASWMSGAAIYLGNDSGISHLAAAIGMPTIVLFRTTDPALWAPRGDHVLPYVVGDLGDTQTNDARS